MPKNSKTAPIWVCPHCGAAIYSGGWGKPRFCPVCRKTERGEVIKNPIRHTKSGWFWGSVGPQPTKEKMLRQVRAIYSSGYRDKNPEEKKVTGYLTAISRKQPPVPLRWLYEHHYIHPVALDYGSGRDCWYKMECYDPYYRPRKLVGPYDTITCIYVLNVVSEKEQAVIINDIRRLLRPGGYAFFAVRRDIPKSGRPGHGTFQRYVILDLELLRETSSYAIYVMGKQANHNPTLVIKSKKQVTLIKHPGYRIRIGRKLLETDFIPESSTDREFFPRP